MENAGTDKGKRRAARKGLAAFLSLCMVFLLAACQAGAREADASEDEKRQKAMRDGGAGNGENAAGNVKKTANVERVVFTYQTMDGDVMDELDEVIREINAITVPEIGVEVEARKVGTLEAFTQYFTWIGNGETIDLMMLNYQDITTYVEREMLLPIDAYLENEASDIKDIVENQYNLTGGSFIDGKTYGVSVYGYQGSGGGIWMEREFLREIGVEHEEKHVYTYEELTEIFAALKEKYPDKYPLGQITSQSGGSTFTFYSNRQKEVCDSLGATYSSGVLDAGSGTKVVNFYATPEYSEFLRYMRKWYLAGYIYPDAAISDYGTPAMFRDGMILSWPITSSPGILVGVMEDPVCLRTSRISVGAQGPRSGFWTIPVTSAHPEAAMRFLNLMYADARIGNLLTYGIEGRHYEVLDEENKIIRYPIADGEGDTGFYNMLGLYGDVHEIYWNGSLEEKQERIAYEAEAMSYRTSVEGFVYSTRETSGQIAAVDKVVERYMPFLESGCLDLDVYYPRFLEELSEAGIDEVIADKQAQYDAWRATR